MLTLSELKSIMLKSILICVLLGALSAQAKVVNTFDECKDQFYKETEPAGMTQNSKKICQYYGNLYLPRFASLYSEHHRIPLYSAYIFTPGCSNKKEIHSKFFIEPQLSGYSEPKMSPEREFDINTIKENQAINKYYNYTGYDRGHLNPSSFQCGDSSDATFTLTNAAPMDACFNRVQWYQWEKEVKKMLTSLKSEPATAYLVTGTVPQDNYRIPRREDGESEEREYEKVTVPSHVWTALCFAHLTDEEKSFSLAYMGKNQPESLIKVMSVPELNDMLQTLYKSAVPISIFVDDCFSTKKKSQEMTHSLYEKLQLPSSQRLQMAPDILNTFETAVRFSPDSEQPGPPPKRAKVSQMTITESFNNISVFFQQAEKMKYVAETACLLTAVKQVSNGRERNDDARTIIEDSVECQMVPEKSMVEGGSGKYCTSPCLYNNNNYSYWCYSGQNHVPCSPMYSAITVNDEKCMASYLCGTYGYDFYWCYRESGSWDFCSPPLWNSITINGDYCRADRACAKYGTKWNWCYDNSNTKQHCCTRDDCFSAIKGKTCHPDYPCGDYGSSYLWCYTVQGSWDYCCKNCTEVVKKN